MNRRTLGLTACLCFISSWALSVPAQAPTDAGSKQKVQVVHTERADFPAGGLLSVKNSVGELTIEGWDRPDVEITTVKLTKAAYAAADRERAMRELDKVRVSVERQGESLVIASDFPRYSVVPRRLSSATACGCDVEYYIKAPRYARLAVNHGSGEVHVDSLMSDIRVTVVQGGITLLLAPDGKYSVDAKGTAGEVISDFPGRETRRPWLVGRQLLPETSPAHNLYLRIGFGDIMILKDQKPPTP
jgi:hypothetical protein